MNVTIDRFIHGKPEFVPQKQIIHASLFSENKLLERSKPSVQTTYSVIKFIARIFNAIRTFVLRLLGYKPTNYQGIGATFDRGSPLQETHLSGLSASDLLSYFQYIIKSDVCGSPAFISCIEKLQQQFLQIEKNSEITDHAIKQSDRAKYLTSLVKDVATLAPGQMRLIVVNTTPDNLVFYLFKKEGKNVDFKIIGRGRALIELSRIEEVSVAGMTKIPSVIAYNGIPDVQAQNKAWLHALLAQSIMEQGFETSAVDKLTAHLKEYQQPILQLSSLAKKTDQFTKALWTVLKHARPALPNEDAWTKQAAAKRLQFRVQLATLIDQFKSYADTLSVNSPEYQQVESNLRLVSEEAWSAYGKGYLSQANLAEIVPELMKIQHALNQQKKVKIPALSQMQKLDMSGYTQGTLVDVGLKQPEVVPLQQVVQAPVALAIRSPLNGPAAIFTAISLGNNHHSRITDLATAKKKISELVQAPLLGHLIETVYQLEFTPYKRRKQLVFGASMFGLSKNDFDLNDASYWTKASKDEAIELMNQLNRLSEWLVDKIKNQEKFPLDAYETLIKMSAIVYFLNSRFFDGSFMVRDVQNHIKHLYNLSSSFFLMGVKEYNVYERSGHRLHPFNLHSVQELSEVEPALHIYEKHTLSYEASKENFKWLYNQTKLLHSIAFNSHTDGSQFYLPSKMHQWMRDLKYPFLMVAYRNVEIRMGEHSKSNGAGLDLFSTRTKTEEEALKEKHQQHLFRKDGMKTQEALADDPEKVTDYLLDDMNKIIDSKNTWLHPSFKASQVARMSHDFSKEELTDLLCLLEKKSSQVEIAAFMTKHIALMNKPEVRNLVDMLFFHPSLLTTLKKNELFNLPEFLRERIQDLQQRALKNPQFIGQAIFLIDVNLKLGGIYEAKGFSTREFYLEGHKFVQTLLQRAKDDLSVQPYLHALLTSELNFQLSKPTLTHHEINSALIYYTLLKNITGNPLEQDPQQNNWIEWKYEQLIQQLAHRLFEPRSYWFILDMICTWKDLPLGVSEWVGTFPKFQNGQYEIDLSVGSIKNIATNELSTKLPDAVLRDPLFHDTFKDLAINKTQIILEELADAKVYLFTDQHGFACRVEEKAKKFHYYKRFPAVQNQILQSVSFTSFQQAVLVEGAKPKEIKKLPYLFDHGFYIEPQNPLQGYCINELGILLFKVTFEEIAKQVKIKHVVDCRNNAEPILWQVISAQEVNHPALTQLSHFEDLSQVLIWGQDGVAKKIELPRYGLTFGIREDALMCLNPQYKGYSVDLTASFKDRKELPFSLLLTHQDKDIPKKLLFPHSSAMTPEVKLDLKLKQIPLLGVELSPYTQEIFCAVDKKVVHFLELSKLALLLGKFEWAMQLLYAIDLKKTDLKQKNITAVVEYLNKTYGHSGHEAAVKLKYILFLKNLIKGDAKYISLRRGIINLAVQLTKNYLADGKHHSPLLLLTKDEFLDVSRLVKKNDTDYFDQHLFPYFLKENDSFSFPLKFTGQVQVQADAPEYQLAISLWIDVKNIAAGHFERDEIYSLNGFDFHSQNRTQCLNYFLPLYQILIEKNPQDATFQSLQWSLKLMAPKNTVPCTIEEKVYQILHTVMRCRQAGMNGSKFPKPPALNKTTHTSSYALGSPIQTLIESIAALMPDLIQHVPKRAEIELPPNVAYVKPQQNLNLERKKPLETSSIASLELEIQPNRKRELKELIREFSYLENGPPMLFTSEELKHYQTEEEIRLPDFEMPKLPDDLTACETEALSQLESNLNAYKTKTNGQKVYHLVKNQQQLQTLHGKLLTPKINQLSLQIEEMKQTVDQMIHQSNDPVEQAAILGKVKVIASEHELMLALLQGTLPTLKDRGLLPSDIDCEKLKEALMHYYDSEVKLNLALACRKKLSTLINDMPSEDVENWKSDSLTLFQLLSCNRHYDEKRNSELLLFEAFNFLAFRQVNKDTHQLQLLSRILEIPTGITQAGTGSGKTTVLNPLRGLMKANGKNLVIQKVLPALLNQTMQIMKGVLGDTMKVSLNLLLFDLKRRLVESESVTVMQPNGEKKIETRSVSLFKNIYKEMLQTIKNRGCLITDYKSLPLLEEKFWKLIREFVAMRAEGISPGELEIEHWTYLKKILILLSHCADAMEDEFDQPNRPIHRIQTQMDKPKRPAQFLLDETYRIYLLLMQEEDLGLQKNLQGDIPEKIRQQCLINVAHKLVEPMATKEASKEELVNYILGKNADVLNKIKTWSPRDTDILALYKDQFCTFLPLTLSQSRKTRYLRSDDGKSTQPCLAGERHEAKFGSIHEEINYTIQDYIQEGVTVPELQDWLDKVAKDHQMGNVAANQRFLMFFPDKSLDDLNKYAIKDLVTEVNKDFKKIEYFLKLRLNSIMMSGTVISMDPQNNVSMKLAVAGDSATLGAPDSFHEQFKLDAVAANDIQAEMVYRLIKRTSGQKQLLEYDPQDPEKVLKQGQQIADICAIIDGAGAYKESDPKKLATKLQETNPNLERVGYFNETNTQDYIGEPAASVEKRGFYFSEAYTRGADVPLKSNGTAILTAKKDGSLEKMNQEDGRMRLSGQKILIARSRYCPEMQTVGDVIQTKACYGAQKQAEDLFRAKKQELNNIVRTEAKKQLLQCENLNECLDLFMDFHDLFIMPAPPTYEQEGSYFKKHQHIRQCDKKPQHVLEAIRAELREQCEKLGLADAKTALDKIVYSDVIVKKMPEFVFSAQDSVETELELEVEEELEVENEQEMEKEEELQFELENEKEQEVQTGVDVPYYLPRLKNRLTYQVRDKIHPAYHKELSFTDSFLPLSRKDPLYLRKPFDNKMYRVSTVAVHLHNFFDVISEIVIGDLLDKGENSEFDKGFTYNIHTGKVIRKLPVANQADEAYICKTPAFISMIAQIKFLDGWIDGYSDAEIHSLKQWLFNNDVKSMRKHFENDILKNRPEVQERYHFSQLWTAFKGLS